MKSLITTTGELRHFLSQAIVGIKNGDLDIQKAAQITKMAAQINESIYSEIKANALLLSSAKAVAEFGKLEIGQ